MRQLAETVLAVVGQRSEIVYRPLPADDPRRRCPDITVARALLGFDPSTPLLAGIRETCADFRARLASDAGA